MNWLTRLVFAGCCTIASAALAVAPQRTFVASYGLDTNACSLTAPCRGFQAAINAVAAGGEVVALDSAGYGAMEIHKSLSVIVPPGVHAGLSPSTGIPLPGYPGQFGVVLIDIQNTDVVVLRGLNINHQGTVTGGVEWISANGGTVHIEDVIVNGFPKEGVYVQAPAGTLFIKNSIFRNNTTGIFAGIAGGTTFENIFVDRVHVEKSNIGIRLYNGAHIRLNESEITSNAVHFNAQAIDYGTAGIIIEVVRCIVTGASAELFHLEAIGGVGFPIINFVAAGSYFSSNTSTAYKAGLVNVLSFGNNSVFGTLPAFDSAYPPQ